MDPQPVPGLTPAVAQPRRPQQQRRLERAGGHDQLPGAEDAPLAVRPADQDLDSVRAFTEVEGLGPVEQDGAGLQGARQERAVRRHLGALGATEAAPPGPLAVGGVAGEDVGPFAAKGPESALDHVGRRVEQLAAHLGHARLAAGGVQPRVEGAPGEVGSEACVPSGQPLGQRAERGARVDDGRPADRPPGQDQGGSAAGHAADQPLIEVVPLERPAVVGGADQVAVLDDRDAKPPAGEGPGDRRAASPAADHDHVEVAPVAGAGPVGRQERLQRVRPAGAGGGSG